MIQWIQEYNVRPAEKGQFELSFGPGGAWSRLYAASHGFYGVSLLADTEDPNRYLVFELWESIDERQKAVAESTTQHNVLTKNLVAWCESIHEIGVFKVRAEGNVRSRRSVKRRRHRS